MLRVHGPPRIVLDALQAIYSASKEKMTTPDGETDEFEIFACLLQGDTIATYLLIITLDYCLRSERGRLWFHNKTQK